MVVFYQILEIRRKFLYSHCTKPLDIWLLIETGQMPLFKITELIFVRNFNEELDTVLFAEGYKLYTFIIIGILFPSFTIWAIIGTFWYAEVQNDEECFYDQQVGWYFALWLIIFYCWIVGYSTFFSYKIIKYLKQSELEEEYMQLLIQYQGIEAPLLNYESQGLSPKEISRIRVEDITNEDDSICSICLDSFKLGEKARVTSCMHKFHLPCIDNWLMRKGSCPNCLTKFNQQMD